MAYKNLKGFCTLCRKYYKENEMVKVFMPKLGVYAFYCKIHRKQCRLKARSTSMSKSSIG